MMKLMMKLMNVCVVDGVGLVGILFVLALSLLGLHDDLGPDLMRLVVLGLGRGPFADHFVHVGHRRKTACVHDHDQVTREGNRVVNGDRDADDWNSVGTEE